MTTLREVVLVCCLSAACTSIAWAQETVATAATPAAPSVEISSSSPWNYLVEPYFLVPTISGTSGIRGLTADVDASSGDILGALDFGAMLYLEMHNPTWAIALDGTYMNLGASGTTRLGGVDFDLKQTGIMMAGYRRVLPWAELMAGLQFNFMSEGLVSSGPAAVDLSGDQSWIDPYLGARATLSHHKWRFAFFGAVGGFGVGSDFAWQVFPQVGYRFNPLFEMTGAFRAIAMDYEDGAGNDEFVYDLTTYGPQLGARFHF